MLIRMMFSFPLWVLECLAVVLFAVSIQSTSSPHISLNSIVICIIFVMNSKCLLLSLA